jgi:hypothetical protein
MCPERISTSQDIYDLVERLKDECKKDARTDLIARFDDALGLGSSGLEIMGAIRKVFSDDRFEIERLLGPDGKDEVDAVIAFVDKAFGR